jgi:hypothetical protein
MIGSWRGKGVETGHPIDGLLKRFGWHGKRFTGPDGAHPLIFKQTKGRVLGEPAKKKAYRGAALVPNARVTSSGIARAA